MKNEKPVVVRENSIIAADSNVSQNIAKPAPGVMQTGQKNMYIDAHGAVNVSYVFPPSVTGSVAEDMIAVQSFSHQYYQLLVTCEEDVFQKQYVTVSKERALSQRLVPPEILRRCSGLSEEGISELKTFPALVCRENTDFHGVTDPNQYATYGYITRVMKTAQEILVAFHPLGVIQQLKLCDKKNAIYFDLNVGCALTDLNHSAWYVHKVNLFQAFDEAGIKGLPRPAK